MTMIKEQKRWKSEINVGNAIAVHARITDFKRKSLAEIENSITNLIEINF